ncbi:hypothetical protein [Nocardia brasiliensis]|uniref:hypothetical protein n=1 Tax=Nocardia brasiliensis TaxID=37326 RepID=UPI003D9307D9
MSTFEQLRQRVLLQAGNAGYGLVRQNRAPYGWDLVTVGGRKPVKSGSLIELDNWLAAQTASDRKSR